MRPVVLFCLFLFLVRHAQGQDSLAAAARKRADTGILKVDSLKTVIVTSAVRPHLKGDTLDYNAANLAVPPNAAVEELLKRLPGLQVAPDGTITYNGEKIKRLLVDGEDIFGDDPTMVTRNFDASKIARVQLLDRKSDQATFTGVDDGARTKTLNLVMKESAKDGYFGRVQAGGNTDGYYNINGALAGFRDNEQFTSLGLASNTGTLASSVNGGAGSSGPGVMFAEGGVDPLGTSAGKGVPKFDGVALHYANKWGNLGEHLLGNYQYSHYFTEPVTVSRTLEQMANGIYEQNQQSRSVNQIAQQWAYITFDGAMSSTAAFNLTVHGSKSQAANQFDDVGRNSFNNTLSNTSDRTIRDVMDGQTFGSFGSLRTQIGRQRTRNLSVNVNWNNVDYKTSGNLNSIEQFFEASGPASMDTIDQRKLISTHRSSLGGALSYTNPLWKGAILGLSYIVAYNTDVPFLGTYNRGGGEYDLMIDSLSSHFKTRNLNQRLILNFQGDAGKLKYLFGVDFVKYSYQQKDLIADSSLRINSFTIAPKILGSYRFNSASSVQFNYNVDTRQPTPNELAPTANNSDPIHITLGNPTLKPGIDQKINVDYRHFKCWLIDVAVNATVSSNSISTKTITDSLGRQISQPVNVDGGKTAAVNVSVTRKVMGFDLGLHGSGGYARTVNYVNADLSRNDAYTGGFGIGLGKFVADKFSLQLNTGFGYFDQVSSVNTAAPVRYWTQQHSGSLTLYFIRGFELNTNASYTWQEKTSAFGSATSVLLWNGYVSRGFLHDRLVARFAFNNLLNANAGITRTNAGNVNTQSSTNILGRYWMISAIWHFDKKFKKK